MLLATSCALPGLAETEAQAAATANLTAFNDRVNELAIRMMPGAETHQTVGSDTYYFALHHAKGGFVQPMALTRGYAKAAKAVVA